MLEMFNNVCFEAYRLETFRESSFFNSKSKCTAKKLAEAGFYYTPNKKNAEESDRVTCYVCNVKVFGWNKTDEPWKEHLKQRPDCFYLKAKGDAKTELTVHDFLTIEKHRFHRINNDEYEKSKKMITKTIDMLTVNDDDENETEQN